MFQVALALDWSCTQFLSPLVEAITPVTLTLTEGSLTVIAFVDVDLHSYQGEDKQRFNKAQKKKIQKKNNLVNGY